MDWVEMAMIFDNGTFDPAERARQKQASRDEDARQLAAGEVTPRELRKRNAFLGALDLSRYRMVAIGGKPLADPERGTTRAEARRQFEQKASRR